MPVLRDAISRAVSLFQQVVATPGAVKSLASFAKSLAEYKVGNYETPSRAYVGRFNFRGTQQQQLIGELSGGERNRVHLAKIIKRIAGRTMNDATVLSKTWCG